MQTHSTASNLLRSVFLQPALRTPLFQPVWKNIHRLALWGMNIGPGGSVEKSGEEWVLNWCASKTDASQPFVLLDGGANVGQYATSALRLLGNRLRIFCFEPSPRTFAKLAGLDPDTGQVIASR